MVHGLGLGSISPVAIDTLGSLAYMHVYMLLRKRMGFNVGRFDKKHTSGSGMDFLESAGFLS